jgi:hypothetical protein
MVNHDTHHWIIATPNGKVSTGVCKHCGETREFSNEAPAGFAKMARKDEEDWTARDRIARSLVFESEEKRRF